MNMLKPTPRLDSPQRDKKSLNGPVDTKQLNQENNSSFYTPYKSNIPRYSQGPGLSLKTNTNKQIANSTTHAPSSESNFDGYLHKVIKSNLDRISQMRKQHEKEKEKLSEQISKLKTQNAFLKSKIQQQNSKGKTDQQLNKESSNSLGKKTLKKFFSQKSLSPNPQQIDEARDTILQMKEKTERLMKQILEYKKRNAILSIEKRNLNLNLEKLLKQFELKTLQLQSLRKLQQSNKNQLVSANEIISTLKRENQLEKAKLQKDIQNFKSQENLKKQKEKLKENEKVQKSQALTQNQTNFKITNDLKLAGMIDKRVIKHLETQLKERQVQIYGKDRLIKQLNEKILESGLASLNTKYKYLMKF